MAVASMGRSPSSFVNVFVGTSGTGNTFPGATLPHGMAQLSPILLPDQGAAEQGLWSFNSGYHRPAAGSSSGRSSRLLGFGHTALSGVGLNDGGDFLVLPCGPPRGCDARGAWLAHDSERASPGFYSASLSMDGGGSGGGDASRVEVQIAAGLRGGVLRATFAGAAASQPRLRIRLRSPLDKLVSGSVDQVEGRAGTLAGWRLSSPTHHCAVEHTTYWHARVEPPFAKLTRLGSGGEAGDGGRGDEWELSWEGRLPNDTVSARLFISHVDAAGAERNEAAELTERPFDVSSAQAHATEAWDGVLGRVAVAAAEEETLVRLYTALYHSMLGPTLHADADGAYAHGERRDNAERRMVRNGSSIDGCGGGSSRQHRQLSTFSLWDTYRAQSPLLTLLEPELMGDVARSLLALTSSDGILPRWPLYGAETGCMSGYPAAIVLADLALKGHVSRDDALSALRASSRTARREPFVSRGEPIPFGQRLCVSRGLEAAVADSCVARLAEHVSSECGDVHDQTHDEFAARASLWRRYFDPQQRLFVPWSVSGRPLSVDATIFDRSLDAYEEGTPLQYSFMVPHDVGGLVEVLGGPAALAERLDSLFDAGATSVVKGDVQPDLATGNLGGHCQGNEPGHHVPYLYNAAGAPRRGQRVLAQLHRMYDAGAGGLPGNDDVGQMSAWFVFTTLGFYPVDPCGGTYELGRPFVTAANLTVPGGAGRVLRIVAKGDHLGSGAHVAHVTWNGQRLRGTSIAHARLIEGGELAFHFRQGSGTRAEEEEAASEAAAEEAAEEAEEEPEEEVRPNLRQLAAGPDVVAGAEHKICKCLSPGGTAPRNGYRCRDGYVAYCAVTEICAATAEFKLAEVTVFACKPTVIERARRMSIAPPPSPSPSPSTTTVAATPVDAAAPAAGAAADDDTIDSCGAWLLVPGVVGLLLLLVVVPRRRLRGSWRLRRALLLSVVMCFALVAFCQMHGMVRDELRVGRQGFPAAAGVGHGQAAANTKVAPRPATSQESSTPLLVVEDATPTPGCPGDTSSVRHDDPLIHHSTVDVALRRYPPLKMDGLFEERLSYHVGQCASVHATAPNADTALLEAEVWQRAAASRRRLLVAAGCGAPQTLARYSRDGARFERALVRPSGNRSSSFGAASPGARCTRGADLVVMRVADGSSEEGVSEQLRATRPLLAETEGASAVVVLRPERPSNASAARRRLKAQLTAAGWTVDETFRFDEAAVGGGNASATTVAGEAAARPFSLGAALRRTPPPTLAGCEEASAAPITPTSAAHRQLATFALVRGGIAPEDYAGLLARTGGLARAMRAAMPSLRYDDVVFHEGNLPSDMADLVVRTARREHNHSVRLADARAYGAFALPRAAARAKGPRGLLRVLTGYSIGYRHMCRFFAMQWVHALREYEFAMRVDDDVVLRGIGDVLGAMRAAPGSGGGVYGFALWTEEKHAETVTTMTPWLWQYAASRGLFGGNATTQCSLTAGRMYFSNFFLTRVRWWARAAVQEMLRAVDLTGSIYRHRWGDAPIQTAALNMFAPPSRVLQLRVNYSHFSTGNEVIEGREVIFTHHVEREGMPQQLSDMMAYATKCVSPCAVADAFREHEGRDHAPSCPAFCADERPAWARTRCCREATAPAMRSESMATRILKEVVANFTGLDSSGMVPYELAKIVQYDVLQADAPMPAADGVVGLEKILRFRTMVAGGSEEAAKKMSDAELLERAKAHPCCLGRKVESLV